MCVIVYKPINKSIPTHELLEKCFNTNPDGAGYMIPLNNSVEIRKGFMTFEDFIEDFEDFVAKNKINTYQTPIVFHFRITTQGGVQKELCHPYPVCRDYEEMRMLANTCDIALAHNGIIQLTSQYSRKPLPYNDTMTFIKNFASLIIDNDIYFSNNPRKCELIENLISGSRLAIMNKYGYVKLIGQFTKVDGIFYSNTHMFDAPKKTSFKFKNYYEWLNDVDVD